MKNGRLHYESNRKEWKLNGLKHRIGGPAVIHNNMDEEYWFMGKRHRIGGPAVIKYAIDLERWDIRHPNSKEAYKVVDIEYWYNGKKYNKEEYDFIILFQQADKRRKYI